MAYSRPGGGKSPLKFIPFFFVLSLPEQGIKHGVKRRQLPLGKHSRFCPFGLRRLCMGTWHWAVAPRIPAEQGSVGRVRADGWENRAEWPRRSRIANTNATGEDQRTKWEPGDGCFARRYRGTRGSLVDANCVSQEHGMPRGAHRDMISATRYYRVSVP